MNDNDLVFVVQRSGGPTAGKDKSIINAHVSKQTHNKRRKERALQAQRRDSLNSDQADSPAQPITDCSLSALQSVHSPLPHFTSDLVSPHSLFIPRSRLCHHEAANTYLDGKAESYLRFGRDVLEPAIHCVGYRGWVALQAKREEYTGPDLLSSSDTGLSDAQNASQGTDRHNVVTFAILAYCASGVATVHANKQAQRDALSYAINCMKSMRRYLADSSNLEDIPEDLVYRLYRAEVLACNYSSASAHGTLLKRIFEGKADSSWGLRLDRLSNALYQDGHRMFGSWTKPLFDETWVELQYREDWRKADSMFDETLEQDARTISKHNVPDPRLATMLVDVRRLFLQTRALLGRHQLARPDNFHWFATRCEWLQICLMNYYLDLENRNQGDVGHKTHINLHLCLTLATLYVVRHAKNEIRVNGKPLFSGSDNIYMRLDRKLKSLAQSMTMEDVQKFSDSIAFMLLVAALAEYYTQQAFSNSLKTWFWRKKFAQFFQQRGLTRWSDVYAVLRGFPYTEEELPLPHTAWFEETMWEQDPT